MIRVDWLIFMFLRTEDVTDLPTHAGYNHFACDRFRPIYAYIHSRIHQTR